MPFALLWFYTVVFQSSEEWQKFPFEYKSIQLFVTGVLYLVTQSCRLPQSHIRNITFVMELAFFVIGFHILSRARPVSMILFVMIRETDRFLFPVAGSREETVADCIMSSTKFLYAAGDALATN